MKTTETKRDVESPERRRNKRLPIIIAVGIVLVAIVWLTKYFWFSKPIGDGPAGPPVPATAFDRAWSDREVVLIGVGDSVTAGTGARRTHSYFQRLLENPPDEVPDMDGLCMSTVFPNLRSRNLAVPGSTSLQHAQNQLALLETYPENVLGIVVMTTGGNDIIHDYGRSPPCEGAMYGAGLDQARPWIDSFRNRLGQMLDDVNAAFPGGCHVFLANIYDPTDGVGDIQSIGLPRWPDGVQILRAYNQAVAECAEQRPWVHLVDVREAFLGHGIHCTQVWRHTYRWNDPHYWYFDNLEDPNERGHDAIRRLFLLRIIDVLRPEKAGGTR